MLITEKAGGATAGKCDFVFSTQLCNELESARKSSLFFKKYTCRSSKTELEKESVNYFMKVLILTAYYDNWVLNMLSYKRY